VKQELILERLPDVFKESAIPGSPLTQLLGVMEELHARDDAILGGFGAYVDPRRTQDEFVPYLAGWVDFAWLLVDPSDDPYAEPGTPFTGGLGRLRELIAAAAESSKWRGTSLGLIRFLETATGVQGYGVQETVLDASGRRLPFHVQVVAPAAAAPFIDLVRLIVEHEKPVHVIADVVVEVPPS
jgi:phage tail-like protein